MYITHSSYKSINTLIQDWNLLPASRTNTKAYINTRMEPTSYFKNEHKGIH